MSLPAHWRRVPLELLAEVRLGRQRSPGRAVGPSMCPYMRAANVTWAGLDLSDVKEMDFSKGEQATYALRAGDILLAEASGSASEVGKPAIWCDEIPGACFQNTLIRVRAYEPEFVPYLFWHFKKDALNGHFAKESKGTGIHHLGARGLASWPIALAPPDEQRQIVRAIEIRFARLDAAVASLRRAKENVKRARASVLKAAVEGRLVPTEASLARREDRAYESASALLARILKERRAAWARSGRRGEYKEPIAPNTAGLPDLPDGWCFTTMDALCEIVGGVTKDQRNTAGRLVPYLRVANVQRGRLDLSDVKTILAPENKIEALRLMPGDVLLNEGGDRDKLGRGWVWLGELRECIHQNHVFRARLWLDAFDSRYLSHYANTEGDRYFFKEGKQTTNLASISLSKVKALPVALPPVFEIKRLLSEVDRRLSVLDSIDATLDANLALCTRLRQSILKRAFEGRLIDADASPHPEIENDDARIAL